MAQGWMTFARAVRTSSWLRLQSDCEAGHVSRHAQQKALVLTDKQGSLST